jgi:D-aminopeptidase
VGAGAGTTCFGFKAGVGLSSRIAGGFVLGCLLVSNYGRAADLHLLVGGESPGGGAAPGDGGSVVVVLATDAPLSERQLGRLARRATFGLGRAGSVAAHPSGEYVFAFSTAHRIPQHGPGSTLELSLLRDDSAELRELFEAAAEATHEAVLGSLCSADAVEGRDGHRAEAFPYELLPAAIRL